MTSQALADRQASAPAPATVETLPTSDMAFIERMALNPAIDPDKLERLIAMQKDMAASRAKIAFTQAMIAMRPEMPRIDKKGKTDKAEYGKWEDIQDGVDPVLSRHGFDLTFKTASAADSVTVTAVLRHREGHEDTTDLTLPADKGPGRNNVQAVGSTVSYGKRYTATALLNLRIGGEDDDGKAAGIGAVITDEQFDALSKLMDTHGADLKRFCAYFHIDKVPDLPAAKYAQAEAMIKAKRK